MGEIGNYNNILLNAAQADADARVSVATDERVVSVTIEDNGTGIPDNVANGESVRSSKASGTGLGLAIARDIVKAHEGKIAFEKKTNGTIVRIQIPAVG